jgi:tetratricopeptide (TPR) repeat protein
MYYRYVQKWVDLFTEEPFMIEVETAHYIKGMHNLASAHFDLKNYRKFDKTLKQFEDFAESEIVKHYDLNGVQVFVYLYIAKLNMHFMQGTFREGLELVPYIEEKLEEYRLYLDRHRVLVFYYKIASLYFGAGDYSTSIDYLNKIINWKVDLRTDLQCYARLLHLIAHYEMGNYEIIEHLIKSVYRFMAKVEHLSAVEEEIFKFLRKSFNLSPRQLKPAFERLLENLRQFENNRYEARAFSYLDIISWLESKIDEKPVYTIIRQKYLATEEKRNKGANRAV